MPIVFDSQTRIFHLSGTQFDYCLYVAEDGTLLNLHWGEHVRGDDLTYLLDSYSDGASFDLRAGRLPYELPTRAGGWYGTPACRAINAQGDDLVVLKYVSHTIAPGKPPLDGLPATYVQASDEATTLIITLRDELTGLTAELRYTVFEQLDALARSVRYVNRSQEPILLTHMLSASVPLYGDDYELIHLKGAWARERGIERRRVSQATELIQSQRGASGHEENPFICLARKDTNEFSGQAWAMNLCYSGSFLAATQTDNVGNARMSIGLNPACCQWNLEAGASFDTPEAVLIYSNEGLNGLSHRFHRLYRTRLCRGAWRDRERPILINNWEATYFDFNEQKLLDIARRAKDIGVELFVLDDGWFGKRDSDNCSLGDWVSDTAKLPDGVAGVARKIHEMGLMFGLWFEPEMVSPDSALYRAHPDWCLHVDGRARTQARNQLILDLSRVEVQDYIIESVSRVLSEAGVDYVKWDMNRNMTEPFSPALGARAQMETQHRYMLGLYRVLEEITRRFPKVLFESCSGGGGRFDPGMLYYMPQTWCSDDTDPVERLKIQYGTSLCYPAASMGAHVSASPNHQTGRVTSIQMRGDVALGGNFGFELDLSKLSAADLEAARMQVARVKALRRLIQQGEFTRLLSPFEGNLAAWQFVSPDGGRVLLCYYQRLSEPNPACRRLCLRGLKPGARYRDCDGGRQYTGAALMYAGLPMPRFQGDYASCVKVFEKV